MSLRPFEKVAFVCFISLLVYGSLAAQRVARADNLADEAELEFELGAERYKAGDFRGALEHFLASNRLVPNRNVVFNIARTYEQLKESADAYRYYNQALEGEQDAATRSRIDEAIAHTLPLIAVLRVETDPPGAAVYIGRKDLGGRGNTPVALGLTPGNYRVMVELPGYEPAEAPPQNFDAGTQSRVALKLKQIVGSLAVEGSPIGASVRLDEDQGPVLCTLPCLANVPPGRHTLFVSATGHQTMATTVTVVTGVAATAHVELAAVTRTLLVASEVDNALVTVDGQPQGFTPAALALPLGPHQVTVSHAGYRPFTQNIVISPEGQARIDADLTPLEEVNAASRVTEAVEDAPSSVSIITREELRAMGYPTIAEALRGVRGVYVGDDTSYTNVGFRGFASLGDYGDHVLVLVDGASTNDDYVGSSYVGYDARADIDDVERIEVVRGPGSALYGTGAFFGVVNLVTRDRDAPTHGEIAVSTADESVGHARATAQVRLSPDAGGWVSVAGAHGAGRDFFFQEYATDPATGGNARGVDGFDTGTVNGRVWYKSVTLQYLLTSRKKTLPSGEFATIFGDPRTHFADTRGLVELRFEPKVSQEIQLLSRAHANLYNFDDFLAATPENGGSATEAFRGRWVGIEQRVVLAPVPWLRFTAGGEYQRHFEAKQTGNTSPDAAGYYLNRDDPFSVAAGYGVVDVEPLRVVKFSGGARFDSYSNFGSSVNPRGALIVHPYAAGTAKLMAGTAFRAPSVYEHYYQGPTQIPGGNLKPEHVSSAELEFTHRFSTTVSGVIAGYYNHVTDLIFLGGQGTVTQPNQYANSDVPIDTLGAEIEVRREWRNGFMLAANYAFQHSRYLNSEAPAGAVTFRNVPNSPEHLGSIKAAAPIVRPFLMAMTRLSVQGPRFDKFDQANDTSPQNQTPGAVIWDVVLSGQTERYGVHYALGLYNAMDYRYSVPVSREFLQESIVQNGRTVLLSSEVSF
jgi:outer membrane receptor for ferrienterochelin and colicin